MDSVPCNIIKDNICMIFNKSENTEIHIMAVFPLVDVMTSSLQQQQEAGLKPKVTLPPALHGGVSSKKERDGLVTKITCTINYTYQYNKLITNYY